MRQAYGRPKRSYFDQNYENVCWERLSMGSTTAPKHYNKSQGESKIAFLSNKLTEADLHLF